VVDDDLDVARQPQTAARWVEGREEPVLGQHAAARERVEERRLAGVRVADDRDDRQLVAVAVGAPRAAVLAQVLDLLLELVYAVARAPAVDLELRLARSPSRSRPRGARAPCPS